ncbi:hypothetical protein VPH35_001681 [Triticum aestivum]
MEDRRTPALDGVEGKMRDLKLSEAEKRSVKIGRRQACSPTIGKLKAVGKLLSQRPAKAEYVGRTLENLWPPFIEKEACGGKNDGTLLLDRNRCLFTFHDESSKKKALDSGPWSFNKDLIYEFKFIPIWVRVYGIPMGMMSSETGELIGKNIGEVLDIDLDHDGTAMGEFMRIKVRMDITVPIIRFITLEIENDEEEQEDMYEELTGAVAEEENKRKKERKIIDFKYEHLSDFCYGWGIIGHTEIACPSMTRREGAR